MLGTSEEPKTIQEDINTLNRVIFGDKMSGDIGMKQKIDEVHDILIKARTVGGFFGGIGGGLKWLIIIAAVIAIIKGWVAGILHLIATNIKI